MVLSRLLELGKELVMVRLGWLGGRPLLKLRKESIVIALGGTPGRHLASPAYPGIGVAIPSVPGSPAVFGGIIEGEVDLGRDR